MVCQVLEDGMMCNSVKYACYAPAPIKGYLKKVVIITILAGSI